jgi:hypothetical protein
LRWSGFGFLLAIQFLSVYLGWHYAIDGYVSIAVVAGARQFLMRRRPAEYPETTRSAAA